MGQARCPGRQRDHRDPAVMEIEDFEPSEAIDRDRRISEELPAGGKS